MPDVYGIEVPLSDVVCRWRGYHEPVLVHMDPDIHHCKWCGVHLEYEEPTVMGIHANYIVMAQIPVHPRMKERLDPELGRFRRWFRFGR